MAHTFDPNKTYGFFFKGDFDNYFLGHQMEEIFKTRLYAKYLENKKDAVVLDVGGNIGSFSLYASKYAKQVYTLEPSLEHFENINYMLNFNEIKNVKPIQKALYIEDKPFPFFHNNNKTMYSLHQAVNDNSSQPETVMAVTLPTLFKEEGITHIDLMKLDIEGSEYEVIGSKSFADVADKIDCIIGESHAWSGRNPNQLRDSFRNNGFEFQWFPHDAQLFIAQRKK